ncbi:MAG: hypothetical protein U0800_12580 [Isosphaeraceae bacterium]
MLELRGHGRLLKRVELQHRRPGRLDDPLDSDEARIRGFSFDDLPQGLPVEPGGFGYIYDVEPLQREQRSDALGGGQPDFLDGFVAPKARWSATTEC